ncbi:Uncharacterised protein [uncultured archaeon]|nr:Uncharacterised protein [uncultured archaeon]
MKFKRLILTSLILMGFFAANMQAVEDVATVNVGQGESLADKLLDTSRGEGIYSNSQGLAPTPQKSREIQKNKTALNWEMPSSLAGYGSSAKSSRETSEMMGAETDNGTSATEPSEQSPSETAVTSAGGSWSFELKDTSKRDVSLALYQNGKYLFGVGNMRAGDSTLQVAASGSVQDDTMDLDIISSGTITLYKQVLHLSGDSASGDYQAFSASGETWTGSTEGLRIAS